MLPPGGVTAFNQIGPMTQGVKNPMGYMTSFPSDRKQRIVVVVLDAVAGDEQTVLRQADDALGTRGVLEDHGPRARNREPPVLGDLPAEFRLGVRLLSGHTPELDAELVDVVAIVATVVGAEPDGVLEWSLRQQLGLSCSRSAARG